MPYELKLEQFTGPLDKLLELIEGQKLEITEISLGRVTNDFLAYLRTLEKIETPLLTDFIVIASRLILIKSKSLLPNLTITDEEQGEIRDLEERLKMYREFKPTQKLIQNLWRKGNIEFGRPYLFIRRFMEAGGFQEDSSAAFYPGTNLNLGGLTESLERIFADFKKFELETKVIEEKIVSIEEKIKEVVGRLQESGAAAFSDLSQAKSRSEIIVIFLAILHLAREQMIFLEQKGYFSDIMIQSAPKK